MKKRNPCCSENITGNIRAGSITLAGKHNPKAASDSFKTNTFNGQGYGRAEKPASQAQCLSDELANMNTKGSDLVMQYNGSAQSTWPVTNLRTSKNRMQRDMKRQMKNMPTFYKLEIVKKKYLLSAPVWNCDCGCKCSQHHAHYGTTTALITEGCSIVLFKCNWKKQIS